MRLKRQKGYALATILVLLGVAMFASAAIVAMSVLESKIASSQREGLSAYYVAEAGVQDALWRLENNSTYYSALMAGTLNATYTANNVPATGSSFTVRIAQTVGQAAGNATIDVTGQTTNVSITAKRRIIAYAYLGPSTSPIGENAIASGANITFNNGGSQLTVSGGDVQSNTNIAVNNSRVNLTGRRFKSVGNYTQNPNPSSNIVHGGINASNYAPAATAMTIPLFDFAAARTAAQAANRYFATSTAFYNAYFGGCNSTQTVTLPGPVTYIDQSLNMDNCYRNKTINVTGQLVIGNGGLNVNTNASNLRVNINQSSAGKGGLFVQQNINNNTGIWNINGVYYSVGTMAFSNSGNFTLNGAMITNSDLAINNSSAMNITYNPTNVDGSFTGSSARPVLVRHWEEEY